LLAQNGGTKRAPLSQIINQKAKFSYRFRQTRPKGSNSWLNDGNFTTGLNDLLKRGRVQHTQVPMAYLKEN